VVAAELGLAEATVYRWKAQDLIDRGVKPGTSTSERGELAAAKRRIQELETELALVTQAAKLFAEQGSGKVAVCTICPSMLVAGFWLPGLGQRGSVAPDHDVGALDNGEGSRFCRSPGVAPG
jgi:transposase